jgi:hypothetical protein
MTENNLQFIACFAVFAPFAHSFVIGDHDASTTRQVAVKDRAMREAARARAQSKKIRIQIQRSIGPDEMLLRSMQQARSVNVVAIITKLGESDAVLQKLKLEQKARGDQYRQVLQPLSMQGVTYLDHGGKSFMYLPDQHVVFECESDAEDTQNIAQRAELAAQNYELRCEAAAAQIAGRAAYCVTAESKVKGIPSRQFYIDQQTFYPLRFALGDGDGDWKISMDTEAVDFPKDMPQFYFEPVGTARKVKFEMAQTLSSVTRVRDRLGFDPILPKKLPFGFQIQRSELRRNEDGNLAMLWLTDGLASARVYEFRCTQMREGIWSRGSNTVLTEDGVTMYMVSDLAPELRKSLLSAFAKRTPFAIPPPNSSSQSGGFGIKQPPVPAEEPSAAKQMLIQPEVPTGLPDPEPVPVNSAGPVITGRN